LALFLCSNYLATTGGFRFPALDLSFWTICLFDNDRRVEQSASSELFSQLFSPSSNILTLEALLDGNRVASNSAALADFEVVGNGPCYTRRFTVSGVAFDESGLLHLGPNDDGVLFYRYRYPPYPNLLHVRTLALSVGTWAAANKK